MNVIVEYFLIFLFGILVGSKFHSVITTPFGKLFSTNVSGGKRLRCKLGFHEMYHDGNTDNGTFKGTMYLPLTTGQIYKCKHCDYKYTRYPFI